MIREREGQEILAHIFLLKGFPATEHWTWRPEAPHVPLQVYPGGFYGLVCEEESLNKYSGAVAFQNVENNPYDVKMRFSVASHRLSRNRKAFLQAFDSLGK